MLKILLIIMKKNLKKVWNQKKIITSFLDNYFSDEEEKNGFLKGVKNICIGGEKWEKKNFTGANERVDIWKSAKKMSPLTIR